MRGCYTSGTVRIGYIIALLATAVAISGCMMPDREKQVAANEEKLIKDGIIALAVGDTAPQISLLNTSGDEYELGSASGQGAMMLFFIPALGTPNSTKQIKSLEKVSAELSDQGYSTAVIIPAAAADVAAFAQKSSLTITLLADPDLAAAKVYGCAGDESQYPQRTQIGIDAEGKIAFYERGFAFATAKAILELFNPEEPDVEPVAEPVSEPAT